MSHLAGVSRARLSLVQGHRTMAPEQIISIDPQVMSGTSVFAGTRWPVESLLARVRAGDTLAALLKGFPTFSREQAVGALALGVVRTLSPRVRQMKREVWW